jgi:hypothetical protein
VGRVREGVIPLPLGVRGLCPRKKFKIVYVKMCFKLISQLILNTERSYSGLLICGYIRGCLRLLLNLLKLVVFEAPETLVQAISCLQLVRVDGVRALP